MIKRIMTAAAMLGGMILLSGNSAQAQGYSDEDVKLFRKDIRSLKKQISAANIELTDDEAQQFWPIYDRYTAEMTKIMDQKFELVSEYLQNHDPLTDKEADAYLQGRAVVEEAFLQLRLKYLPVFRKVL